MTPPADRMGECAPGKEVLDALDRLKAYALRAEGRGQNIADLAMVRRSLSALREEAEQLREERDEWQRVARETADNLHAAIRTREQRAEAAEAELARYREGLREMAAGMGYAQVHRSKARALLAAGSASEAASDGTADSGATEGDA